MVEEWATYTSGSLEHLGSTTDIAGRKPNACKTPKSKQSPHDMGTVRPSRDIQSTPKTFASSLRCEDQDTKSELVSQKVAPVETAGHTSIDEPNANSTSQQNKNVQRQKRRSSTDLLLIAAAQREASDSKKPAKNNGHGKKVKKEKVSSSPNKRQQKQPLPTKKSGKNKGTPRPHVYHDFSLVPDTAEYSRKKTGGVSTPFPEKLMEMLSRESRMNSSIVSWLPHGRAFIVRKPKEFSQKIMHRYFRQTKITSFQRQLNLYGFRRLTQGPDTGAYYHEVRREVVDDVHFIWCRGVYYI